MTTTTKKLSPDEILAQFDLDVNRRGFEMQRMRSGLISTSDAIRTAVFEQFSQGFIAIKNAIDYTKLLGGESKEEQIQAMKNFVSASSGTTKEASDIVENMLDRFSTEYQTRNKPSIAGPTTSTEQKDDSNCDQPDAIIQKYDASSANNTDKESCCTVP
jgi:hypothetical protein